MNLKNALTLLDLNPEVKAFYILCLVCFAPYIQQDLNSYMGDVLFAIFVFNFFIFVCAFFVLSLHICEEFYVLMKRFFPGNCSSADADRRRSLQGGAPVGVSGAGLE